MKPIVVYDDACTFCRSTKQCMVSLDSKNRFTWIGISQFNYKKYGLTKAALLQEMHLLENKTTHKGYYAFKEISRHVPFLFLFYLLLCIPGVDYFGKKLYHVVATHRK